MAEDRTVVVLTEDERDALETAIDVDLLVHDDPERTDVRHRDELVTVLQKLRGQLSPTLTVPEAAELLGYAEGSIYRKVQAGEIPHRRVGERGAIRFWPDELLRWMREPERGENDGSGEDEDPAGS